MEEDLEEIVEEAIADGKSEEEAINYALTQMGSFDVVGSSLNKVHKAAPDWVLVAMTSLLIAFGIGTLVFMKMNNASELPLEFFIRRTGLYLIMGIAVLMGISKLDYRSFKKYSKHVYIGTIGTALIFNMFQFV